MAKQKSAPTRKVHDLKMIEPKFDSSLTQLIIDLEYLRRQNILRGTTPPEVFRQLQSLYFMLESIGSARIEGNNTTIIEYTNSKLNETTTESPFPEIANLEQGMRFIEENTKDYPLNRMFLSELHKYSVRNLPLPPHGEGDETPGVYRLKNVAILKSEHLPPESVDVPRLMEELFRWINDKMPPRYDLLKVALAHHRFVWIHPFTNGNGRTARLFTYAMLVKYGFTLEQGRIVNPVAVFCASRADYYRHLQKADSGTEKGLYDWCEYVLSGLKLEIEKVNQLTDYDFLRSKILFPAVQDAFSRGFISELEEKILALSLEKREIKLADVMERDKKLSSRTVSRAFQTLKDKKMLSGQTENSRIYRINFIESKLLPCIISAFDKNGFLPMRSDE